MLLSFFFLLLNFGAFTGTHAVLNESTPPAEAKARALDILAFSLAINILVLIAMVAALVGEIAARKSYGKLFNDVESALSQYLVKKFGISAGSLNLWLVILTIVGILLVAFLAFINVYVIAKFNANDTASATTWVNVGFGVTVGTLAIILAIVVITWFVNKFGNQLKVLVVSNPDLRKTAVASALQAEQSPQPATVPGAIPPARSLAIGEQSVLVAQQQIPPVSIFAPAPVNIPKP